MGCSIDLEVQILTVDVVSKAERTLKSILEVPANTPAQSPIEAIRKLD